MGSRMVRAAAVIVAMAAAGPAAFAAEPFYGYSGYFGGPATYYSRDADVQLSSTRSPGLTGFGTRVYTRGGPFWRRQGAVRTLAAYGRRDGRRVVLRRRG